MSSGFGFKGREGRCYRFWKDVEECSVRGWLARCLLGYIRRRGEG